MLRGTTVLMTISLFAAAAMLSPALAGAQQVSPAGKLDAFMPGAMPQPVKPDPFQRPGYKPHSAADENAHADAVPLLQLDRSWNRTYVQYAFAAPTSFYSPGRNQISPAEWDSALTGVFAAYLDHSGTFTRMTTNLELDGEQREASAVGNPRTQALTAEWELGRLVPSRFGWLDLATGIYRQRLLSYAPFANTAIADTLAGAPVSGAGVESSVTLPDRNLSLTFRYGRQHLDNAQQRQRVVGLGLSWSW